MFKAITKPDMYGIRELTYFERRNKTVEKIHIGKSRLALYKAYQSTDASPIKFLYSFSDHIRDPFTRGKNYGGEHVTFRWLYALLSSKYNQTGTSFLDNYFSVDIYFRLGEDINKIYYTLNRRDSSGRFISNNAKKQELLKFEHKVKKDCVEWLHEGNMGVVSEATQKRRLEAGITTSAVFFATGQLINDMTVTVALNEGEY